MNRPPGSPSPEPPAKQARTVPPPPASCLAGSGSWSRARGAGRVIAAAPETVCHSTHREPGDDAVGLSPVRRAPVQTLPDELLYQIFHFLPLSAHSACARVCRRWHASLPDTRIRIARWLAQLSPLQRQSARFSGLAWSCRIAPWLAGQSCPLRPQLVRQHKELLRVQALCASPDHRPGSAVQVRSPERQALCFFSCLLHYVMHQQMLAADALALVPVALPQQEGQLMVTALSPCGQWLARVWQQVRHGDTRSKLDIWCWQEGAWRREVWPPSPPEQQRIDMVSFSERWPDTLFIAQGGGQVLRWYKNWSTGRWRLHSFLHTPGSLLRTRILINNTAGDCITLSCNESGFAARMDLTHYDEGRAAWGMTKTSYYQPSPSTLVLAPTSLQLALATQGSLSSGRHPEIHVWQQGLNATFPGQWGYQNALLARHHRVIRLIYSPDSCFLLGLMAGQRVCLWQLDDNCRLQPRLELACAFSTHPQDIRSHVLFRNDSQQLAVPCPAQRIQLWTRLPTGDWQAGASIDTGPLPGDVDEGPPRYILFSGNGRMLVSVTRTQVGLWQLTAGGHWCIVVRRQSLTPASPLPNAWLLPPGQWLCASSIGREGDLWIHGQDAGGQCVRKASLTLGWPVQGLYCSLDGLSLLLFGESGRQQAALQLSAPGDRPGPS